MSRTPVSSLRALALVIFTALATAVAVIIAPASGPAAGLPQAGAHNGASLMNDVEVIGLEPRYYPAASPVFDTPEVAVPATLAQAVGLAAQHAVPVLQTARDVGGQFRDSVNAGRVGVMQAINDDEASSGCHPEYMLTGYSQSAKVLLEHERELARRGQLAGVISLGNPNTAAGD